MSGHVKPAGGRLDGVTAAVNRAALRSEKRALSDLSVARQLNAEQLGLLDLELGVGQDPAVS
jgi:hypothetical protein